MDFLGYRFSHNKTLLRKDMKQRFARKLSQITDNSRKYEILCSYKGWCMAGDCRNLWRKITGMKNFNELNVKAKSVGKDGKRFFDVEVRTLMDILNQEVIVKDFETGVQTRNGGDRYAVLIEVAGRECKFITNNYKIKDILDQCREKDCFPFKATIKRRTGNNNKADYYFE